MTGRRFYSTPAERQVLAREDILFELKRHREASFFAADRSPPVDEKSHHKQRCGNKKKKKGNRRRKMGDFLKKRWKKRSFPL